MRRLALLVLTLSLAIAPAATAASAYRIPPPAPRPAPPVKPAARTPAQQSRPALAGTLLPQPAFQPSPGLAALGLAPMGLGVADQGPACRQACASSRYMCGTDDETCADQWRQCIQACSGLGAR